MKPSVIRWIDKNLGRPFCFFLTLDRGFCDIFKKNNSRHKKCAKILFIKLIEQGSTVLAYPALKKAQDSVRKENVYFMVFRENRPILDILDVVAPANIIEVDSRNLLDFIYSVSKGLIKIRKQKIDTVIDMEFFSRASAILSYLSGAGKRVGLHRFSCEGPYRGDLFTHKLIYNPYLHTKVFFASLVEALNHNPSPDNAPMVFKIPEITNTLPYFSPTEDGKKSLIEKVERLKQSTLNRPIIILNPNTSDLLPIRRWPEKNFIRLGKMVLEEFTQATVIITGTGKEKERAGLIASQIRGAVSLAGHTSLRELLILYCIAEVLVTNDSGPALFSTLTPIKSVILFGPETPFLYGGLTRNVEIIAPDLVCSPCVNVYNHRKSPCKTGMCLRSIKVEDVYQKVKTLMSTKIY